MASQDAFIQLTAMATSNGLQKSHCPGHVHNNPKLVVATVYLANEETGDKEIHYSTNTKGRAGPGSRMIITAACGPTLLGPCGNL